MVVGKLEYRCVHRQAGMVVVVLVVLGYLGVLEVQVGPSNLDRLVDLDVQLGLEGPVDRLFLLDQLVHLLDLVDLEVRADQVDQEDLLDHLVLEGLEDPWDRPDLEVLVAVVGELAVVEMVGEVVVGAGDNMGANKLEHMY